MSRPDVPLESAQDATDEAQQPASSVAEEIALVRRIRKASRRPARKSKLDPYRTKILDQLATGASYADVAFSLRLAEKIAVNRSTVYRFWLAVTGGSK